MFSGFSLGYLSRTQINGFYKAALVLLPSLFPPLWGGLAERH